MDTKLCNSCNRTLPLNEFYVRKDTGREGTECKECKRARSSRYFHENVEQHRRTVKRRYDTFGRFWRYGLSVDDYDAALAKQGGCCALCRAPKPGGKGKWHIDHAHTGEETRRKFKQSEKQHFRGLLCHRCNIALGHYEALIDSVGVEAIVRYLGWPFP